MRFSCPLRGDRRSQGRGNEIDHGPNAGQHPSPRRKDEMQNAVDTAPFGQHLHERARCKRISTVRSRQQRNSSSLTRGGYQNLEAACRNAGLDRYCTGTAVVRRKMPDLATLLLLMKDGELAKVRWCRGFTFLRQQGRTCDEDPSAWTDSFHLKVGVGVE